MTIYTKLLEEDRSSNLSELRPLSAYFFLMGAGSILMLARNLVFAKLLTVAAFGYLALVNVIGSYGAVVFNVGLLNGLGRELPVALGRGEEAQAVYLRNLVLSTIIGIITVCAIPYLLVTIWWAGKELITRYVLWAAYAIAAVIVFYQFAALELRGRQLLVPFALIVLIQAAFTFIAGIFGALLWGLLGAIIAVLLGYGLATGLAWRFWIHGLRWERLQWSKLHPLFHIGIPLLLSTLCVTLIQSMDRFFVVRYFGIESLGHYHFAGVILTGGQILSGIVVQWVSPQILYAHGQGVTPEANYRRVLVIMATILAFFLVTAYPVTATCSFLVARFFPPYVAGIPFIGVFYLSAGFMVINLASVILNALNRQGLILAGTAGTFSVMFTAYVLAGVNGLPILAFAWIFLGGQVLLVAVLTILTYGCVRRERQIAALA